MKKIGALILAVGIALGVTGCGHTLEERTQTKETCEAAEGNYVETTRVNGFGLEYLYGDCHLDR